MVDIAHHTQSNLQLDESQITPTTPGMFYRGFFNSNKRESYVLY